MIASRPFGQKRTVRKVRGPQERHLTCCVAAICRTIGQGDFIVTATDSAITYGNITSEVLATKFFMTRNWVVMSSGSTGPTEIIGDQFAKALMSTSDTAFAARDHLRREYKRHLAEWCADRWLAPYNLEMSEFLATGRNRFGDERFAELTRNIENDAAQFDGSLLLAGWGQNKKNPSIFVADRDGVFPHNSTGFAAIGSGREIAMNSLFLHKYTKRCLLEYAIYFVAAAKFASESDKNVGENTYMWVAQPGAATKRPPGFFIRPDHIDHLRSIWEIHGRPKTPNILRDSIGSWLAEDMKKSNPQKSEGQP